MTLFQMLPMSSALNHGNMRLSNSVLLSYHTLYSFGGSNRKNLCGSKFGAAMSFTMLVSAFRKHVSRIYFRVTNKQMLWINAARVVAFVTNKLIRPKRHSSHLGGSTMGVLVADSAISSSGFAANPLPTSIGSFFINLVPERFVSSFCLPHAISRAVLPSPLRPSWTNAEWLAANTTFDIHGKILA